MSRKNHKWRSRKLDCICEYCGCLRATGKGIRKGSTVLWYKPNDNKEWALPIPKCTGKEN